MHKIAIPEKYEESEFSKFIQSLKGLDKRLTNDAITAVNEPKEFVRQIVSGEFGELSDEIMDLLFHTLPSQYLLLNQERDSSFMVWAVRQKKYALLGKWLTLLGKLPVDEAEYKRQGAAGGNIGNILGNMIVDGMQWLKAVMMDRSGFFVLKPALQAALTANDDHAIDILLNSEGKLSLELRGCAIPAALDHENLETGFEYARRWHSEEMAIDTTQMSSLLKRNPEVLDKLVRDLRNHDLARAVLTKRLVKTTFKKHEVTVDQLLAIHAFDRGIADYLVEEEFVDLSRFGKVMYALYRCHCRMLWDALTKSEPVEIKPKVVNFGEVMPGVNVKYYSEPTEGAAASTSPQHAF